MNAGDDAVTDSELMQYLHGELSDAERARIDARAATLPDIAERLRVLRKRNQRLSTLLRAADPSAPEVQASADAMRRLVSPTLRVERVPPDVLAPLHAVRPPRWYGTPRWLKAAAVVALLLGGVMIVEPARAWVIEHARALAVAVGAIETPPDTPAPQTGPAWRFSFPWTSTTLVLDPGSARGTLVVRRGADSRVTVESFDAGTTRIALTTVGTRITSAGADPAEYVFILPPSVTELRVMEAGGVRTYPLASDFSELRVPLP